MAYVPPQFAGKSFTCPHCDVYAQFWWLETKKQILVGGRNVYRDTDLHIANCHHCSGRMVWFVDAGHPHVLYPSGISAAPLPHAEMPENVKRDYVESREIVNASPRGALLYFASDFRSCVFILGAPALTSMTTLGGSFKQAFQFRSNRRWMSYA